MLCNCSCRVFSMWSPHTLHRTPQHDYSWRLPICLINQPESKKATVCNRHQTRNRKIQSEQIMNARGMPGIMQVECIPRLWPGPGLGLKLWSLGLGLWAGPGPWARAWAQAAAGPARNARRPRHRPRTRPKPKAQAPKLQPKARPGPKPGNAPDLHDSRHASGIHNLFALDLARLRTPEAVPSLFQVVHKSLETMPN